MKSFYIKQKVFSLKDRYTIYDENQNSLYHCEGKMFSISGIKKLYRHDGKFLFTMKRKIFSLLPTYYLVNQQEQIIATIHKKWTFLTAKLAIESDYGDFHIHGDWASHHFDIFQQDERIAQFSKKWISWGDTYEITIEKEELLEFLLALVILIDDCIHNSHDQNN